MTRLKMTTCLHAFVSSQLSALQKTEHKIMHFSSGVRNLDERVQTGSVKLKPPSATFSLDCTVDSKNLNSLLI